MPTQIPIQNDNCLPCRDERKKQLRIISASLSGRKGSYPLPQLLKFAERMDCSTTAMGETLN